MAPKKLLQRELFANGWVAYAVFLSKPAFIAILAVVIWFTIPHYFGITVASKRDEDILTNLHVPGLMLLHGLFASVIVAKVLGGTSRMWLAIRRNQEKAFREALEERIPPIAHMLLATLSIQWLENTMTLGYESVLVGAKTVWEVAFVLALYWQVATVLDDPTKAPGLTHKIPSDWRRRIRLGLEPGMPLPPVIRKGRRKQCRSEK